MKRKKRQPSYKDCRLWRRERDSNPRTGISRYTISRSLLLENSPYMQSFVKNMLFQCRFWYWIFLFISNYISKFISKNYIDFSFSIASSSLAILASISLFSSVSFGVIESIYMPLGLSVLQVI